MYDGNVLPNAAGFSHDNDSDAWDPTVDPNAVKVEVVLGKGDTEDGLIPSPNATVLLVDDKKGTGANCKFLFTHQLRPKGSTPRLFEVGVTLIARWRLVPPTTGYNNEYSMGNVGVAEDAESEPNWSVGAFYASAMQMEFVPPELGGHPVPVDSSNSFQTVWMTAAYDPADKNNLLINVYLDGATVPAAIFSQTGWDPASRAAADNVYFGLTQSPSAGTMQLDYIGAKVGVHAPARSGFGADAGPDQVVYEGETVSLDGSGSPEARLYSWTQVLQPGDPVTQINDAEQAIANFMAPEVDQGVMLTFQLTVRKKIESDSDTTRVTVRAANPPAIPPPKFTVRIGHLSAILLWDPIIDADTYLLGIASEEPGQEKGPFFWLPVSETSYRHVSLLEGWNYYYKLKAANSYGEGPDSGELRLTAVPNLAQRTDVQPFARVVPQGQELPRLHDGQTATNAFYSDDGANYAEEDWFGYTWNTAVEMDRLVYYAGENRPDGGWWKRLTLEYSWDGGTTWQQPSFIAFAPSYPVENVPTARPDYGRYVLTFPVIEGNALRIIGIPGGSSYYAGAAEVEVYGPAFENEVYVYAGKDQVAVEGNRVALDGTRTANAESYLWKQILLGDEPTVALSDATSPTATFIAPFVTGEATLTFELNAAGVGGPRSDQVKVRVVEDNPPAAPQWSEAAAGLRIAYLSWKPSPGANTYTVLRSAIPDGAGIVLASGVTRTEYLDEDAPAGVHFYTVRAAGPAGSTDSDEMAVASLNFADLDLTSRDIGNPQPGSTTYDPATGIVTVEANGQDIWDHSDSFRFDYYGLSGDFEVIAEAESLLGPAKGGKMGIMIRDNLQSNSVHCYVCSLRSRALSLQGRNVPYSNSHFSTTIGAQSFEFPIYLRLGRKGTTFTGSYRRPDGEWHMFSPPTMVVPAMADPVYAGVAVTSQQSGTLVAAEYSHFAIVGRERSPGVGFRTLPADFAAEEPVHVQLTVGVDPTRRPDVLEVVEMVPEGTIPMDFAGGDLVGSTIVWRLPSAAPQNRIITYTLSVSPDVNHPLSFSGEIVCDNIREGIPGDSILYRTPSSVGNVTAKMLLSGHLTWDPNSPAEGVVGYHVYRSADGGEWQRVAALVADNLWIDHRVGPGVSYSYKVTAETVNGIETDLVLSQPTPPVRLTLDVRECEDYDFNGGNSPGGPGADGIAATSIDDLTGTDYFYQNTDFPWYDEDVPNIYRPDDAIEIFEGEGARGWSLRNVSGGDWFRYTFHDVPEGDTRIVLSAMGEGGAAIAYHWDEVALGRVVIPKSAGPAVWMDYSLPPFPTVFEDHVLRIKVLQGTCHLDTLGIGYNWSGENRQVLFTEDFDSYSTTGELESAGWVIYSGSEDRDGSWQLWNTEGEPIGPQDPDLPGMNRMYVISNSDLTFAVELDEELISPTIDCEGFVKVRLRFSQNINVFEDDPDGDPQFCEVDLRIYDEQASSWGDWVNVHHHERTGGDDQWPEDIDLSGIADLRKIQLRWHFYETYYDYWFAVDNITISGVPLSYPSGPISLSHDWVVISWGPFGTGRYTIEYADSLTEPEWRNVPGAWPITQTSWSGEEVSRIPMRFYRVVSE